MRRSALLLAAVVAVLAATAAPAAADSISYIKDGDIWLTTPDGARQVQVTHDGGYAFASQADDGTLLGLRGQRLRRLDRSGRVLADFTTPVSEVPPGGTYESLGPVDPMISPDGTKVAYGYHFNYVRYDPDCGRPGGCRDNHVMIGTAYSWADRTTGWDEPGLGRHSGWSYPSWIDNSTVLMSDVAEILNDQVWIDVVGDGQHGRPWFAGHLEATTRDAELNRQGDLVATVESRGTQDDTVRVYQLREPIPRTPWLCLTLQGDKPAGSATGYENPSFSPDGRSLAVGIPAGIAVVRGIDTGCTAAPSSGLLVAGARHPDWGPADVPAPASGGGGQPGGGQPGGGQPGGGQPGGGRPVGDRTAPRLAVPSSRLRVALRRGIRARVDGCTSGRPVAARATSAGRVVARGTGRCRAGRATVTLRFTPAARRRLARRASVRLTVTAAGARRQVVVRR